jgi:hypothetical protein
MLCYGYKSLDNVNAKFSLSMPWKHIGEVEAQLHSFWTSPLDGGVW